MRRIVPVLAIAVAVTASLPALARTGGRVDPRTLHAAPVGLPRAHGSLGRRAVRLSTSCAAKVIRVGQTTTCRVHAWNASTSAATSTLRTRVGRQLTLTGVTGDAARLSANTVGVTASVPGRALGVPSIGPGSTPPGGFLSLAGLGIVPVPLGRGTWVNLDVPPFRYAGDTYTRVGATSDGYAVVGGVRSSADVQCCPLQTLPDPARPNNVLAPYWTDLDGTGDAGLYAGTLTNGTDSWFVLEWHEHLTGLPSEERAFEVWIGLNGTQDVSYAYDPAASGGVPPGLGLTIGAENANGSGGAQLASLPSGDLVVTATDGSPGGALDYVVTLRGASPRIGRVKTRLTTPPSSTVVEQVQAIRVRPRR
jgi:hypothetical protein